MTQDKKHGQIAWGGILALCLLSSIALADSAQDTTRAEEAFRMGDLVQAMTLWRRAAQQNDPTAQVRLGQVLDVAEQNKEAVKWFRKAAAQGNAAGEFGLGNMYSTGEGIKKDIGKAFYWIHRAAEQDYLLAVDVMAQAYRIGDLGLPIDLQKSQTWEKRALMLRKGIATGKMLKKTKTK